MASSATNAAGGPDFDEKQYWTHRDFKTSSRLFMQHWMWQLQLGYALHPSIPPEVRSNPNLKIADVACGNGAWLFELKAPETTQLDGYDLSPNCFGAEGWLPKNVTLTGGFDALTALDESLKGKYDIVHARAFASIPKNGNVKPFIETLMGMLSRFYAALRYFDYSLISFEEPGGYLQWEEPNPGKLEAKVPEGGSVQSAASQGLVQLMHASGARVGLNFDWITNIKAQLQSTGFEVISYADVKWRPEFQKGWNDNLLTVYEELGVNFPLAKDAPPNFPMTREQYNGMFAGVVNECMNGVWLYQPGWSVLAKRP